MSIADVVISPQVFRPLEREVALVLNSVLKRARRFAQGEKVDRKQLEDALEDVITTGSLEQAPKDKVPPKFVSPDDYSWLDRRLDPLRTHVIEVASHIADRQTPPTSVTPDLVRKTWDFTWNNRSQRLAAFQQR